MKTEIQQRVTTGFMKRKTSKLILLMGALSLYSCEENIDLIIPISSQGEATFTQQWSHDFDTELPEWVKGGVWGFPECNGWFEPSNVKMKDGICELTITERTERIDSLIASDTLPYNCADYVRKPDDLNAVGEMYGRFSSYMKVTAPPGVIASFFLAYYDWSNGFDKPLVEGCEIDIEFCGSTKEVQFAIHYVDENKKIQSTPANIVSLKGKDAGDGYHLWEIEWLPTTIKFFMDGELLSTYTDQKVLKEMEFPMFAEINYWVTQKSEWDVGQFDSSQLPITTHYDYVSYASWDQE